jgi:uncharacterized LabA/DUF88 family protein
MLQYYIMKKALSSLPTYVYIDGSNIRLACKIGLRFDLDYKRLHQYFVTKYPNLKRIVYFEGRSSDDTEKRSIFKRYEHYGYEVLSLERKKYITPAVQKSFVCKKCKNVNKIKVLPKVAKFKSNVDVYLCSEMMFDAMNSKDEIHLILLSCDGDYAEMVRKLLDNYPQVSISVIATPFTKPINYLSTRLVGMRQYRNYRLVDISTILDKIAQKSR